MDTMPIKNSKQEKYGIKATCITKIKFFKIYKSTISFKIICFGNILSQSLISMSLINTNLSISRVELILLFVEVSY